MPRPLTAAQHGIWTAQQLDPASPAFNTGEYVEIFGQIDENAFVASVRQVLDEVEVLEVGSTFDVPVVKSGSMADALRWMSEDMARAGEPLLAHVLFRVSPERFVWYHRVHHILLDGYGVSLVARRVAEVYTALASGQVPAPHKFGPLGPVLDEEAAYESSDQIQVDRDYWVARSIEAVSLSDGSGLPARYFHRHSVDLSNVDCLRDFARESGTTWPEVLLAVVAGYVSRLTGAGEVVVGLPVMGRLGSTSLRVPCTVLNAVPLRVRIDPGDSLSVVARRVADEVRSARPHLRYRYERLRRDLGLLGGQRRLFGPVVNIMPFDYGLRFGGHRTVVSNLSAGPIEDLSINVYDRADGTGLRLAFDANPNRYRPDEVAGHADGVLRLLESALRQPEAPLVEPPQVLDGGRLPVPARPVLDLIAEHTEGIAIESEHGSISYPELLSRARRLASALVARGITPNSLVGVQVERGIDAITAILGVLTAGAAYLPLDPNGPPVRTAEIVADAGPAFVITEVELGAEQSEVVGETAYVIYTSGSTGKPNGVVISHRALSSFVVAATDRYGISASDKVLQFAALHFDASVEEIFLTLCAGGTLVVRTEKSIPELLTACADHGVTVLDLPTAYWHELAYALSTGVVTLPPSIRLVIIGGESVLSERVDRWLDAVDPSVRLINTYGPTETTVVASTADLVGEGTPIGLPLAGVRATIVNGELVLSGDTVATGYLHDASPFADGSYRTGDLVRLDSNGLLHHVGRVDDQFKISGHRVDPAEVETVLLSHPAVRQAAVVGQVLAGGTRRLSAHVVADDPAPTVAELRKLLGQRLAAAVVPGVIVFTDRLPTTASGKIDRAALRAAPPVRDVDSGHTETEQRLLAIWRDVLGRDDLSIQDDFFESGGQSLQTIQIANRAGVEVGLVFQHPTVAELAAHLAGAGEEFVPAAIVLNRAVVVGDELPERILLTGATGYVGRHLLAELVEQTDAEIICLVRGADRITGTSRVRAVQADLAAPRLGLDDSVRRRLANGRNIIYHNAAAVSALRGYGSLRAVNVDSTRSLIELASEMHYVSTLGVAPSGVDCSEDYVPAHSGLRSGYQQSKWAGERLVQLAGEGGLPANVYRLGRVVGDVVNTADPLWRVLFAGIPLGLLPELHAAEVWTPVDYVARTIVHLSRSGRPAVVNVAPSPPLALADLYQWIRDYGFPVTEIPLDTWCARLSSDATDLALFRAFSAVGSATGAIRAETVIRGGLDCPPIDRTFVHRCLDRCVGGGLLPRPGTKPSVLPTSP